jgi:hypothetical protein
VQVGIGPQLLEQCETIEAWHHHVGQDQVGMYLRRGDQRFFAI